MDAGGRLGCDPVAHEFAPLPIADAEPFDITTGPDGNLWFVQVDDANFPATSDFVGRITPAGVVTESPLATNNSGPLGITAGPDGNVWFTEEVGQFISSITPATPPVVTTFPGDAGMSANAAPAGIAAGPDGNLWYTDPVVDSIGRFTLPPPDAFGTVVEYSVGAGSNPNDITVGSDGALWFTEPDTNSIGRITPTNPPVVTHVPVPTAAAKPIGITAGPDGNLWFTERSGNRIGRINTPLDRPAHRTTAPIAIPGPGSAAVSEIPVAGLQGTITDVRVELTGISHPKPDDIEALLVGPQGQKVLLVADVGGSSTATGGTLNLQGSAPYSLADDGPLVSGMFKPTNDPGVSLPPPAPGGPYAANSLAAFNGSNPNGTWKLFVADDLAANSGAMHGGWGIDITTTGGGGGGRGGDTADPDTTITKKPKKKSSKRRSRSSSPRRRRPPPSPVS